jgi:hypothetical protein
MIPLVSAQQPTQTQQAPEQAVEEEPTLAVPLASKPLGPEDLDNGNWLNGESWEDSLEVPFYDNRPERRAYLRVKESRHEKFPNFSVLVDAVTDTAEKPFTSSAAFAFDTENIRYNNLNNLTKPNNGVYVLCVFFKTRGGPPVNIWAKDPQAFPSSEFCHKWSRGPSPIPGSDEARLKPHVLYGFLFSMNRLTNNYENSNIGLHLGVMESESILPPLSYSNSIYANFRKTSFSGIPIPEFPWPTLVLAGGTVAAALATRRFTRREVLCLG